MEETSGASIKQRRFPECVMEALAAFLGDQTGTGSEACVQKNWQGASHWGETCLGCVPVVDLG